MFGRFAIISIIISLATVLQSHIAFSAPSEDLKNLIAKNHREFVPSKSGLFPTIVIIPGAASLLSHRR